MSDTEINESSADNLPSGETAEQVAIRWIEGVAKNLSQYFDQMGPSHELSIAKLKIDEAVMWARQHILG